MSASWRPAAAPPVLMSAMTNRARTHCVAGALALLVVSACNSGDVTSCCASKPSTVTDSVGGVPAATTYSLVPNLDTIAVGASVHYAIAGGALGSSGVQWKSSDDTIAIIDATGNALGRKPGTVTIEATILTSGRPTATATLVVMPVTTAPDSTASTPSNPKAPGPPIPAPDTTTGKP